MPPCPRCSADTGPDARFCGACGVALDDPSQVPTTYRPSSSVPPPTPSSLDGAFAPGQLLAGRYRIVALLGRGGMGEVYRADDLKLGQPVALKFLPVRFGDDPARLERFHAEVRHARQVSHPHVCRVHDIGDLDGQPFLSMEYVDGEDLATLLRRIGRLPPAKGIEIARQLCAGLAAAHDRGVLHRDLKPANVMIDGHGRARITDFGLAVREDEAEDGASAGTPAYMAPERIEGKPATVQSDLYALGLVLYEIFTGQRAFGTKTLADLRRAHLSAEPTPPSDLSGDIDPSLERVILRCLEKDPEARPKSASQIALALPGGDPLSAAIAAGETPSPEMVAAAGSEGTLTRATAWSALAGTVLLVLAGALLAPWSTLLGIETELRPPETIRERARDLLRSLGYADQESDTALWIQTDYLMLRNYSLTTPSPARWKMLPSLQPNPLQHFFRSSLRPLVPLKPTSRVDWRDPDLYFFGDVKASFGPDGRIQAFRAVAAPSETPGAAPSSETWDLLFSAAGLDRSSFLEVAPTVTPFNGADRTYAWEGEAHGAQLRIEAASLGGRPVQFNVTGPHDWDHRQTRYIVGPLTRWMFSLVGAFLMIVTIAALFFARRNLRLGRSDTHGAMRLALFVGGSGAVVWLLGADHALDPAAELALSAGGLGLAALQAVIVWAGYLAIEPYLRRRWPTLLIAWSRLLGGGWRDPLVGRELLIGVLVGSLSGVILYAAFALPGFVPVADASPLFLSAEAVSGPGHFLATAIDILARCVLLSLCLTLVLVLALTLFHRRWIAVLCVGLLLSAVLYVGDSPVVAIPLAVLLAAILSATLARIGLLAFIEANIILTGFVFLPVALDPSRWWAPYGFATLALLIVPGIFGFRIALGQQSPLGGALDG